MKFSKNSWISELNRKYAKVSLENLDAANVAICKAIEVLDKLNKAEAEWFKWQKRVVIAAKKY